jgi:hypothetical protein
MNVIETPGFSVSVRWTGQFFNQAPKSPGIYMFHVDQGKSIHRLKGASDIIYVGSTARGRGGLRQRLRCHSRSRILKLINTEVGEIMVSWKDAPTNEKALFEEAEILWKYLQDHLELPPANHQTSSLKNYKKLRNLIEGMRMTRLKKAALWEQWSRIEWYENPTPKALPLKIRPS